MKVKATKTEYIDVDIRPAEVIEQVFDVWKMRQGFDWIREGKLYTEEYTSHSWTNCKGEALPHQIEYYNAFLTVLEATASLNL